MAKILKIENNNNNSIEFYRDGDHFIAKAMCPEVSTPIIIEMDIEELKNVSDFLSKELKVMFKFA
ncbi:MAG: hypothetical protein LBR46_05335 [Prevotella sp.]|jgi:hypothetical protein|nr:hypothetical protein [Prevotella sp.]